ncbi:hypothetical protein [Agrobacterium pusense]|uniref:hypothetical protein n=1 Tax=Agrobacterium pusense TaxID=648995 RepID=UPI001C6ED8E5|nr:hypothetical protein [Agrobacterium pusense]MBW9066430.1 hypothetical protein [Agrobacterium pusense]MBW9083624.1 hypothetical protein [Agrobacterium pusense]MBW9127171.1 hypothetical protein [Agrobacterium pusense]MBW9138890.1 hypothetical protein [Agrobacterium pusense]
MFLLRLDHASLRLLDEVRMHFGDEAALHQVEHVHLGEDAGDQAVDFEGGRLVARGLADHHFLH